MSRTTRVIVQGITGQQGAFHTRAMLDYGTKVVGGVTPGKGGEHVHDVPVYNSVQEAARKARANASCLFVPARFALDAALEALEEPRIKLLVVITEHIPVHDAMRIASVARARGVRVVGPNCPGIAVPGVGKIGIMPDTIFRQGSVGVVSRSGTLTYEIVNALSEAKIGQSTVVGIGGDPVQGTNFLEMLNFFQKDKRTESVVLVGEIGGNAEEAAASYIRRRVKKPVVAYIAGRVAPPGKTMGHAGAIISGRGGTAAAKVAALEAAGVKVADRPGAVPELLP
jgi:succinyl-CoA synthetase alpha subunit